MAVDALVSVVIPKVTDLLIQESKVFDKVVDQVEDIRIELRRMRGFLTDAEERQKEDDNAKNWVQKYLETLYNVEDMVERYALRQTKVSFFQHNGFRFLDLKAYKKLRRKLKQFKEDIQKLNDGKPDDIEDASLRGISIGREGWQLNKGGAGEQYSESHRGIIFSGSNENQTKQMLRLSYKEKGSDFVGFKDEEKEMERILSSGGYKRISVSDCTGSGKTTLVKRVYDRKSVKEKFKYHAWLDVSEERILKNLLLRVSIQLNEDWDKELRVLDEKHLKDELGIFLQGKKYLIVLDDAREKPDAWRELIHILPHGDDSKVVLITSESKISESLDMDYHLRQRLLDENESWELMKSYINPSSFPDPLRNQIFDICDGLPLNIVLLGGYLSTKMCYEELSRLVIQIQLGSASKKIWELSYTDLPAQYKLCLLYLTLFPKEFDVSVRRILRLWLAEGFLQCPPGRGLGEDLAEECFNYLVKRNLILVSKLRSDGGPRKCHLPGFLHEHLLPIAQNISLFQIHEMSEQKPGVRRIVEYADMQNADKNDNNYQDLRSYLSINIQRYYDTPAEGVGNFLRNIVGTKGFGLLRVLDLEGVYKPLLPTTLKHFFQLRYLGLRWTFLDSLPNSIGDLPYLETLDLKRTCINTLPSSVWKLKRLRHLYLPQVRLDINMQQPPPKLLTLWGLNIENQGDIKNSLDWALRDVRELGITCLPENFGDLMKWIISLTQLQSLKLTSKDDKGCPSNLQLESLLTLVKLSGLELLGKLIRPPSEDRFRFPPNLKVLTLSVSHLEVDPMEVLSELKCLSVLRLLAKSYIGQKMNCPKEGFTNLRVLKLWMLDELEEWIVQEGAMPCIKELNIRRCQKLNGIPSILMQRNSLEKLIVTNMPKEFEDSVRKIIPEHTLLKTNTLDITPLPWEMNPDLWK